ncbi:KOW motif-containing protein [Streptomyces lavenduligriseus]|nr:KOW motif-containing protein [Streptomyces lavenduligriseus]
MSYDPNIKVGDRVEIVRDENSGKTGVVAEIDRADSDIPYRIVDGYGDFLTWAREVRKVDNRGTLTVGDRVVITGDLLKSLVGKRGTLTEIDERDTEYPYLVHIDGSTSGGVWVQAVRREDDVEQPVPAPAPTSNPFAAHVEEAKRLLVGTEHSGADVIRLAEILAGRW